MNRQLKVALIGNPNTGKSTVFNALTGLRQHTGNWSGKTVDNGVGHFSIGEIEVELYDLPGIYSLFSHSGEEYEAKRFISLEKLDITLVMLDATCLERNLPLALHLMEMSKNVIICLNLMDEAEKKQIKINKKILEEMLGVPVATLVAREKEGLEDLKTLIAQVALGEKESTPILTGVASILPMTFGYLEESLADSIPKALNTPFFQSFLLEEEPLFIEKLEREVGKNKIILAEHRLRCEAAQGIMASEGYTLGKYQEERALLFLNRGKAIADQVVKKEKKFRDVYTQYIDRIIMAKTTGIPIMLLLMGLIFWITIAGANVPSAMLMEWFQIGGTYIDSWFQSIGMPWWIHGILLDGVYLTVSWVISVMLPPMAIFFPLFTVLEDFGLLPRIAFHLDGLFQRCGAHGKQALTMAMGFGCNAAGVTACRIIDSPKERLIAILTNNFVPCNGRFPTLILIATLFLSGGNVFVATGWIFFVILLSVAITLGVSWCLSRTVLKGMPSTFVLELPPYRKPKFGQVLVRSLLDRTIFVLARAVTVAIPAGAMIWVMGNVQLDGNSLLFSLSQFLDPIGSIMGLSGAILLAFILGMPANEIVIPILMMIYCQSGMMIEAEAGAIFTANGWTWLTGLCAILFSLNHFPCATTLMTIQKETKSHFWTAVSFILPTVVGIILCCSVNLIGQFFIG